jgi:tetratricopeptide (TPR) repeat protein
MNADPATPRPFAWATAIFAVTLALFLPPGDARFLNWDDDVRVLGDAAIRGFDAPRLRAMLTGFSVANYTPVERLSCAVDWALWGPRAWGFRLTNAFLHAANAALWFALSLRVLRLGGARGRRALAAAAVSACAFALHPLRVESVAWISERRDVLGLFWSLLAVGFHLRRRGGIAFACFLLALLSKASAVSLPIVLWLLDAWPLKRFGPGNWRPAARCLWEKGPWLLASAAVGAVAVLGQQWQGALAPLEARPLAARVAAAGMALATWCAREVAPFGLGPYYDPPDGGGAGWLAVAWVAGTSALLAWRFRRWPAAAVAWFSFLAMAAPLSGLLQAGGAGCPDRYTYVAMLPFALLAGGLVLWPEGRAVRAGILLALGVALAAAAAGTWRLIPAWSDSRALWARGVATAPGSYVPLANLASAHLEEGDLARAAAFAREAARMAPTLPQAHAVLAEVHWRAKRWGAAARELEAALAARSWDAAAHERLSVLLARRGDFPRATRHAFAAFQSGGGAGAEANLGILLWHQGRPELGVKHLRRAAAAGSAEARAALGAVRVAPAP